MFLFVLNVGCRWSLLRILLEAVKSLKLLLVLNALLLNLKKPPLSEVKRGFVFVWL